jgi:deoxyribodipyrimidine photo-lyase
MSTGLVWLRRDLRLADHPAFAAACAAHESVLPVYIHAPQEEGSWAPGAASRWWLHRTLAALRRRGVTVESQPGNLLAEPWGVNGSPQRPYKVFTPFWRRLESQQTPLRPLPEPRPRHWVRLPGSLPLEALELEARIAWASGLARSWRPGERGAHENLRRFLERALTDYAAKRDRPGAAGTSRLPPHLHFGEITPRQIHHALHQRSSRAGAAAKASIGAYLRELGWREFAHRMLYHYPGTCERNFNRRFDAFRWAEADAAALAGRGCLSR